MKKKHRRAVQPIAAPESTRPPSKIWFVVSAFLVLVSAVSYWAGSDDPLPTERPRPVARATSTRAAPLGDSAAPRFLLPSQGVLRPDTLAAPSQNMAAPIPKAAEAAGSKGEALILHADGSVTKLQSESGVMISADGSMIAAPKDTVGFITTSDGRLTPLSSKGGGFSMRSDGRVTPLKKGAVTLGPDGSVMSNSEAEESAE